MVMLVAHKQKEAVVFPITAHYGSAALEKQIERQNLGQIEHLDTTNPMKCQATLLIT